jgi:hypothetical protein
LNVGWFGRRRDRAEFGIERLERPRGVLAARHAKIQPLLALDEDRIGIVLAIVPALAAILLAHRRHHAPPQRPAFRKPHALDERHGGIVPGRRSVIAVIERAARFWRGADLR